MSETPEVTPRIEVLSWSISLGESSDATGTLVVRGNFLSAQYLLEDKQGEVLEVPTDLTQDASDDDVVSELRAHLGY